MAKGEIDHYYSFNIVLTPLTAAWHEASKFCASSLHEFGYVGALNKDPKEMARCFRLYADHLEKEERDRHVPTRS